MGLRWAAVGEDDEMHERLLKRRYGNQLERTVYLQYHRLRQQVRGQRHRAFPNMQPPAMTDPCGKPSPLQYGCDFSDPRLYPFVCELTT